MRPSGYVTDLDAAQVLVSESRGLLCAPLTDAVRSPAGGVSVGVLSTLLDLGTSDSAFVAGRPDWPATQDLAVYGAGRLVEGPIVVDSRLVRAGRKALVVAADVYDGRGQDDLDALREAIDKAAVERVPGDGGPMRAATGLVTFARLPRAAAPGRDDYDPAGWIGQVRRGPDGVPTAEPLHRRLALQVRHGPSGQVELPSSPYVQNSIGTILGGAQAVLVEAAAEAMRPGMVATDVQLRYLSQLKVGPARTCGTVVRDAADHTVVQVELVDAGNRDQLLALATVTLQQPDEDDVRRGRHRGAD